MVMRLLIGQIEEQLDYFIQKLMTEGARHLVVSRFLENETERIHYGPEKWLKHA